MNIDLFWDDEQQTVLLAEFKNGWTWDDLHAVLSKIKSLSDQRGQVFGAIVDVRDGLNLPGSSLFNQESLKQFRRMLAIDQNGEKGPMVIVGMNDMVKTVFNAVSKFDRSLTHDVHFAKTMTEARQVIYGAVKKVV